MFMHLISLLKAEDKWYINLKSFLQSRIIQKYRSDDLESDNLYHDKVYNKIKEEPQNNNYTVIYKKQTNNSYIQRENSEFISNKGIILQNIEEGKETNSKKQNYNIDKKEYKANYGQNYKKEVK